MLACSQLWHVWFFAIIGAGCFNIWIPNYAENAVQFLFYIFAFRKIIENMVRTSYKDDIHRRILQAARGEFLQKGFKDTSMRTISWLLGVTLSNIYNYFRDKDDIFRAVLTPLLNAFEQLFAEHNSDDYMSKEFFSMDSHQKKLIDDFMVIPTNYKTELKILLFNSAGSSLENFRDTFVDRYTQESLRYMKLMKERYPSKIGRASCRERV